MSDVNACFWVKAKVANEVNETKNGIIFQINKTPWPTPLIRFKFANSLLFLASESFLSIGVSHANNLILLIDVNISFITLDLLSLSFICVLLKFCSTLQLSH